MSEQLDKEETIFDADKVADWLARHPDFFKGRDELLASITLPHPSGQAISLLERQVTVLRERNEQFREQISQLMETAVANDVLFEKTRLLILALLNCSDLDSLTSTLNTELGFLFESVESHLFFITDAKDFSHLQNTQCVQVKPWSGAQAVLGEFFERKRTWCGPLTPEQAGYFFPDKPGTINSAAIVPVHVQQEEDEPHMLPLLVSGSTDPDYFHSKQDTLFLDFIGEVIAALLQDMLKTPD